MVIELVIVIVIIIAVVIVIVIVIDGTQPRPSGASHAHEAALWKKCAPGGFAHKPPPKSYISSHSTDFRSCC